MLEKTFKSLGIKFPNILETKEDFCQQHQKHFTNEHHQLPSGKTIWLGCDICQRNARKIRDRNDFIKHMTDIGMQYDRVAGEWYKINAAQSSENDYKARKDGY